MNSNFIIKICLKSPESVIYAELIWKKGDIIVMRNAIYEQNESVVLVSLSINLSYIKSITTLTEEELSKYKKTIMDAPGNDLECACKQVGDEMKSQEKTTIVEKSSIVEKPITKATVKVEKPTSETPVDVKPETKKPVTETPVDVKPEIKKPVPETPVTAKPDLKKQEFKKQDHKKQESKKPVDSKKSETHKNTDSSLERKFSSMKITNTPVEDSKATPYKPFNLGKQDRPTTSPKQAVKQDRPVTPPPKQHVKQDRPVTPPPKQGIKQDRPSSPTKQGIKQDRPLTPPPKQSTKQVTSKHTTSYKSDRPSTPPKPSNWETFNASVAKPDNGWNKKEEKPTYNKSNEKPAYSKSNVKESVKDNVKDEKPVYSKSSEKPVYNKTNEKPVYNKSSEKPVYNKASPTKPHPDTKSHPETKASPMKNHTDTKSHTDNKFHPDTKPVPKSDYKPKQDTRYTNNNSNYNAYNNYKKEVATNVVYKTNRNIEVSFKGRKYTELAPLMQALRGNMATLPKSEEWGIPGETTVVEKGKKILVAGKTKFYNRRNY